MYPIIYIINLESSTDRRNYMDGQFTALSAQYPNIQLDIHYFPAVHGIKNPDHPVFKKYNAQKHLLRKGRNLSLSELGCIASHYLVWQQCQQDNTAIIVLEDDAVLLSNFFNFLQESNTLAQKYNFLWLHKNLRSEKSTVIEKTNHFNIAKFYREFMCTTGYLITPNAAKQFLDYFDEILYPVDDQMSRFYENKIENLSLIPPCIADAGLESIITKEGRQKTKLNISAKIKREFYSTKDRLHRVWHNIKFWINHQ